jgi:hypothetical protein
VFDASEGGSSILFFDEADALFGKRNEVKDGYDHYANTEMHYLVQCMEYHPVSRDVSCPKMRSGQRDP